MPGKDGAWLQPRFSILADDTSRSKVNCAPGACPTKLIIQTSVERCGLAVPPRSRRAWLVAKSRLERLR